MSATRGSAFRIVAVMGLTGIIWAWCVVRSGAVEATTQQANATATRALKAVAIRWAKAVLSGTADSIESLQGPECAPTKKSHLTPEQEYAELKKLRAQWARTIGHPLNAIKIRAVRVRNVTSSSGDAEVEYNFPRSVVGNYNWVGYKVDDGRWKVSDCHLPIAGRSAQATPATPSTS